VTQDGNKPTGSTASGGAVVISQNRRAVSHLHAENAEVIAGDEHARDAFGTGRSADVHRHGSEGRQTLERRRMFPQIRERRV
jgi:hypothetical protein